MKQLIDKVPLLFDSPKERCLVNDILYLLMTQPSLDLVEYAMIKFKAFLKTVIGPEPSLKSFINEISEDFGKQLIFFKEKAKRNAKRNLKTKKEH